MMLKEARWPGNEWIKDKDDVERGRAARKRRTDRELLYTVQEARSREDKRWPETERKVDQKVGQIKSTVKGPVEGQGGLGKSDYKP